jgi:NAD(P)H-flavin reductase
MPAVARRDGFRILSGIVARFARPGQFAIVMAHEVSERIPLTLCDWETSRGTITAIIEDVGRSSHELARLRAGNRLAHVTGPLGLPMEIRHFGRVVLGGGCYGIGAIYPLARALRDASNYVTCVIEACTAHSLYMEQDLKDVSDELIVATKDGSRGTKGGVQDVFASIAKVSAKRADLFIAIGCAFMMRMTAEKTRDLGVPLRVALNPIMVDGTGMCGACRLSCNHETKFACVDGPIFDGHAVDWDELFARRSAYMRAEIESMPQNQSKQSLPVLQQG